MVGSRGRETTGARTVTLIAAEVSNRTGRRREDSPMNAITKIVATAALGSTLALGAAGAVGAATTGGSAAAPSKTPPKICAKAPALVSRLEKLNGRYDTWLPKAQSREAAAKSHHRTRQATRIGNRINRLGSLDARANALVKKVEAVCPGSGSGAGKG
ncbi:MAG: hypothetical protein ACYDHU_03795 [Acidimicrobiales bacterium]